MKTRTYEEIKDDARKILRTLMKIGWSRGKIMQTIRFYVTNEELVEMDKYFESRVCVSSGTGHVAYAGMKITIYGIPIVLSNGEVENRLF
jgi:hypothetical protein